jgi:MFS family permease
MKTSRREFLRSALCGVTLTVRFWARFSDHSGSGPAMLKTMWAFSLTALLFLTITPGTLWARLVLPAAIVLTAVFGAAYAVASHRAMLNYVQEHGRVGYTTLWNFFVAGLQGLTPIGAGFLIDHLELTGFRICFALSAAGCFLCGFATHWVVKDSPAPVPFPFVSPAQPLRTLARTVWITAGLHESNRPERTRRAGNRERS